MSQERCRPAQLAGNAGQGCAGPIEVCVVRQSNGIVMKMPLRTDPVQLPPDGPDCVGHVFQRLSVFGDLGSFVLHRESSARLGPPADAQATIPGGPTPLSPGRPAEPRPRSLLPIRPTRPRAWSSGTLNNGGGGNRTRVWRIMSPPPFRLAAPLYPPGRPVGSAWTRGTGPPVAPGPVCPVSPDEPDREPQPEDGPEGEKRGNQDLNKRAGSVHGHVRSPWKSLEMRQNVLDWLC